MADVPGRRIDEAAERELREVEAAIARAEALERQKQQGLTTEAQIRKRTSAAAARSRVAPEDVRKDTAALKENTAAQQANANAIKQRVAALESEATHTARATATAKAHSQALRENAQRSAAASPLARIQALANISEARKARGLAGAIGVVNNPRLVPEILNFHDTFQQTTGVQQYRSIGGSAAHRVGGPYADLYDLTDRLRSLNRFGPTAGQGVVKSILGDMSPGEMQRLSTLLDKVEATRQRTQSRPVGPVDALPRTALSGYAFNLQRFGPRPAEIMAGLPSGGAAPVPGPFGFGGRSGGGVPEGSGAVVKFGEATDIARLQAADLRRELGHLTAQADISGQTMRKHGALTSEFIQAAQRGEVTIRELGYQTSATIGKFGGWLGAGAAVYGVLGAVTALGKGAIDSYSGVNQLSRVITEDLDAGAARESFRALAQEFNLPIADVADAAYQMGKVFHDQNEAFEASRSVLYSVKVGELDVATATRYLTAITNGFNLEAGQMPVVFDQINQAQNRFGITISDVEAGVAKAAGTFNQASGPGAAMEKYHKLLALITTAQKATGVTGEVAGTAIARAPNFLRQASNQQALADFGIDASAGIDQVIEQAFKIAGGLSGERLQQLASAIFGPQYGARIGTPLLQQADLYRKVLRETDAESAKGSAETELQRQLGSIEEQGKRVIVSFQRLGGALADSGVLDILGLGLKLLNETLDAAVFLTDQFNKLPDGLQKAVAYLAQAALIVRLLRRLQFGEFIAGGPRAQPTGARAAVAGFFGEGDRGVARRYRAGSIGEQRFLEDTAARTSSEAARAAFSAQVAAEREIKARQAVADTATRVANENRLMTDKEVQQHPAVLRANDLAVEAQEERAAAAKRARLAEDENTAARKRLTEVDRNVAATRRPGRLGLNVPGALAAAEADTRTYVGESFDRPSRDAPIAAQALVQQQRDAATRVQVETAHTEALALDAERQADRARGNVTRWGATMSRVGSTLTGMLGGFGNLLFGVFAIGFIADTLKGVADSVGTEIDRIGITGNTAEERAISAQRNLDAMGTTVQDVVSDIFTMSGEIGGIAATLAGAAAGFAVGGPVGALAGAVGGTLFSGAFGGESTAELANRVRRQEQANYELQLREQREARAAGDPVPFRNLKDINKNINAVRERNLTDRQAQKALKDYREEIRYSLEYMGQGEGTTQQQYQRYRDSLKNFNRVRADEAATKDLESQLRSLSPEDLTARIESELTLASLTSGGVQGDHIKRAGIAYREAVHDLGASNAPEDVAKLAEARDAYYGGLQSQIEEELEQALNLTTDPLEQAEAYDKAFQNARQRFIQKPRQKVEEAAQKVRQLQSKFDAAKIDREFKEAYENLEGGGRRREALGLTDPGQFNLDRFSGEEEISNASRLAKKAAEEAERLRNRLRGATNERKKLRSDLKDAEERYEQIVQELDRAEYERIEARKGARVDLRAARTADPLEQSKIRLDALGRQIERAVEAYQDGLIEIDDVLALRQQRIEQRAQRAQSRLARRQAEYRLDISGITDDDARERAEIAGLRDDLAFMEAHPNRFDPTEVINLQAEINERVAEIAEQAKEDALALRQARLSVEQARAEAAGNEIRAAVIGVRSAQLERQYADTPTERLEALAGLIQARATKRDAIYQSQLEDIEFQADIGRLTLDEQIRSYQRLLENAKINRDQRRDLRRRIYDLKQQAEEETGGFDLTVGNIKLPTVYEIRRAMQGGVNPKAGGVNVNQDNKVAIHVHDSAQAGKVAEQLDKALGGSAANALRSAGV